MPDYEPTPMVRGQIEWEVISTPDRVALEERAAQAERRLEAYKKQFREIYLEGMSLADWHTKHCAAQQVAVHLQTRLDRIRAYAEKRKAYGTRGRTVHSSRIASDLERILDS